jgi:hypothetical protein
MLTSDQINDLHRLYWSEHWPIRKIERHPRMGWKTIKKYLDAPAQGVTKRERQNPRSLPVLALVAQTPHRTLIAGLTRGALVRFRHSG